MLRAATTWLFAANVRSLIASSPRPSVATDAFAIALNHRRYRRSAMRRFCTTATMLVAPRSLPFHNPTYLAWPLMARNPVAARR